MKKNKNNLYSNIIKKWHKKKFDSMILLKQWNQDG